MLYEAVWVEHGREAKNAIGEPVPTKLKRVDPSQEFPTLNDPK